MLQQIRHIIAQILIVKIIGTKKHMTPIIMHYEVLTRAAGAAVLRARALTGAAGAGALF